MYLEKLIGSKGRISYPIIEHFMQSGMDKARIKVDKVTPGKSVQALYSTLRSFLRSHPDYPVAVVMRKGRLYLIRVDK